MFKVIKPNTNPRAVVIMYGWVGAADKHVKIYANLYSEQSCAVIYGTASYRAGLLKIKSSLSSVVLESTKLASNLIKESDGKGVESAKTPVVLHYFCNGGAFIAERFHLMVKEARDAKAGISMGNNEDLLFTHERLSQRGFEVIDSAPASMEFSTGFRAIDAAITNIFPRFLAKFVFAFWFIVFYPISILRGTNPVDVDFWNNMTELDLCSRQAFIYSKKDRISDYNKIDNLIAQRRKRGIEVVAQRFEESDHVMHLRKYPEQYKDVISKVLETISS